MRLLTLLAIFVALLTIESNGQTKENEEIIDPVEHMASFPGGNDSLKNFVDRNLIKPTVDFRPGRVFVSFVVNKDGELSNFEIARGLSKTCDEEALRVVRRMPDWIPGTQNGIPVRQKFVLPIKFE